MTTCLVVDASFTFRLLISSPMQPAYQEQARQWIGEGLELVAPSLWLYEMTSALSKVVRYGDLDPSEAREALALTHQLGVRLLLPDEALTRSAFEWTVRLGRGAAYDSFYVALAERLGCEPWTADQRLRNAVDLPWACGIDGGERV